MRIRSHGWLALLALLATALPAQAPVARLAPGATPPAVDPPLDQAIEKLTTFLTRYPDSKLRPNALFQLGELLVRRADESFAAAQRAGGQTPDHPDYGPAIARYEELVQRYPDFEQGDAAAYTLGTLYFADQRYADAAKLFSTVTARDRSAYRAESFFRLGDALFEIASKEKGDARRQGFVKAADAYENATKFAPPGGDIYFFSLYKLGWAFYSQATQPDQPEYQKAVDVFGRLIAEYDKLTPEQQARLGLRHEAIEYMAVAFTQVGGAEAAEKYFAAHQGGSFKLPVLRRVAANLRDQGDFARAVQAFQAIQQEAPNDSGALAIQNEIIDIYQNRVLDPEKAQAARLELVERFAPGTPWAQANPALADTAQRDREVALRQSAQFELARAQEKKDRARYGAAAELYGRYMKEFASSDSAQAVDFLSGEALYGQGQYYQAGIEYSRAAYGLKGDAKLATQAGQNAIVAFDSAVVHDKSDRNAQDSLFTAIDRYVAAAPTSEVARKALIEKGRRASEAQRWDVVAAAFQKYAELYPNDAYTPTAQKLIGDALFKQGQYTDAQAQWERAQAIAAQSGRRKLADSISTLRNAAAVTYGDSLVKAGNYQRAAQDVYVAYADRNPTTERAPEALRNAIETYMLADSAARAKHDDAASKDARTHALELTKRLVEQYPNYKYRVQYQGLQAQLLADLGQRDEAVKALDALVRDNPTWPGRADAMVRMAVELDSLHRPADAAAAYARFAAAYPKDKRAADAQYNAAATYLQAGDSAAAARALGTFAARYPADPRVGAANQQRVLLLKASGNAAAAESELARLCAKPSPELKASCDERTGQMEFEKGQRLFARYQPIKLVIQARSSLTRAGIQRMSADKRELLKAMATHFTASIKTGAPEWVAASSYYTGLAQWEYGEFLKNVVLPKSLTAEERSAAEAGAAKQAEEFYAAARQTWQALVTKAETEKFSNPWVDRARAALQGNVDQHPAAGTGAPGGTR